jgi:excisionase family DNA binding protein
MSESMVGSGNSPTGSGEDRLLTVPEAARFVNLSVGGLYHLIVQRRIPVVRISSRCVRFRRQALLAWIESLTQSDSERS